MKEKTVSVSAIKEGTVIDHITQGSALAILRLLKLSSQEKRVTVGLNLTSRSMGYKDLIKVEGRFLSGKEAHDIALFAPLATICLIKNYRVEKKMKVQLPEVVEKILVCPNPCCISRVEPVGSRFSIDAFREKILLRCFFCEKVFNREDCNA